MKRLHIDIILLITSLALFFNIERLDFGIHNIVDLQSFVYVLATLTIISILLIPTFRKTASALVVLLWIGVYLLGKTVVFNSRPLVGGLFTYLFITEVAFITLLTLLAHRLAQSLHEFKEAVQYITLLSGEQSLPTLETAEPSIRAELTRSRYYHRPMSVIIVELEPDSVQLKSNQLVAEMQQSMAMRYTRAQLGNTVRRQLRLMDQVMEDAANGRFVLLCPEVDRAGSSVVVDRIQDTLSRVGVKAKYAAASFPEEGLTFDGLLKQAQSQLYQSESMTIPAGTPVTAFQNSTEESLRSTT